MLIVANTKSPEVIQPLFDLFRQIMSKNVVDVVLAKALLVRLFHLLPPFPFHSLRSQLIFSENNITDPLLPSRPPPQQKVILKVKPVVPGISFGDTTISCFANYTLADVLLQILLKAKNDAKQVFL